MKINYKELIKETAEELLEKQKGIKEALFKDRLRYLHSLKIGESKNQKEAASKINLGERAGQKIWTIYKKEGLKGLLTKKEKSGRPRKINEAQVADLKAELKKDKMQFQKEIVNYLEEKYSVKYSISGICVLLQREKIKKKL